MADLDIPHGVLEAAAERASGEQQSLSEVVTALLRDYAEGRTWANLPVGAVMAVLAGWAQPPEGTVPGNCRRRSGARTASLRPSWCPVR